MIRRFNSHQVVRGVVSLLISAAAYAFAIGFVHYAFRSITFGFGLHPPQYAEPLGLVIFLGVVTWTGIARHRADMEEFDYASMDPYALLQPESGGEFMVARFASRVTGPAYIVSRIALAAPLRLLRAIDCFQAILPPDAELEAELMRCLDQIKSVNRWQDVAAYHGHEREISLLIRMELLDYSPRTGKIRAREKAQPIAA